jgi:hypothetical protein
MRPRRPRLPKRKEPASAGGYNHPKRLFWHKDLDDRSEHGPLETGVSHGTAILPGGSSCRVRRFEPGASRARGSADARTLGRGRFLGRALVGLLGREVVRGGLCRPVLRGRALLRRLRALRKLVPRAVRLAKRRRPGSRRRAGAECAELSRERPLHAELRSSAPHDLAGNRGPEGTLAAGGGRAALVHASVDLPGDALGASPGPHLAGAALDTGPPLRFATAGLVLDPLARCGRAERGERQLARRPLERVAALPFRTVLAVSLSIVTLFFVVVVLRCAPFPCSLDPPCSSAGNAGPAPRRRGRRRRRRGCRRRRRRRRRRRKGTPSSLERGGIVRRALAPRHAPRLGPPRTPRARRRGGGDREEHDARRPRSPGLDVIGLGWELDVPESIDSPPSGSRGVYRHP